MIPEFAIIGHPNEGKSSVVSTLSEDDSVRISTIPGETINCRIFPVTIDGEEIIRVTDTPGFQNPRKALQWIKDYSGSNNNIAKAFCEANQDNPLFQDEYELFAPIARGAGIIYVVDASRPLRKDDIAEMEILRLTGRPRMSILNCKENEGKYLEEWKKELLKNFNSTRIFNAHRATYAERIRLLESLKAIDQDWYPSIEKVISAFKQDWNRRNIKAAEIICDFLKTCLLHSSEKKIPDESKEKEIFEELKEQYKKEIEDIEKQGYIKIKKLFKHNIFNASLPPQSILNEDLFGLKTWNALGLTSRQVRNASILTGMGLGALADVVAAGISFGVFTAIGGAVAGVTSYLKGEKISEFEVIGIKLGKLIANVTQRENPQFLYVVLDRALIYYSYVINWAHGRRNYPEYENDVKKIKEDALKKGFTHILNAEEKKILFIFYKIVYKRKKSDKLEEINKKALDIIKKCLDRISENEL
ncbi:MAG: GTPase/DUF3482 domain-containing protein [Desulfobacterales bacterium]|nr:GTPase/DUF3482 domain-containing protein [Desulfobacterales bacterium]